MAEETLEIRNENQRTMGVMSLCTPHVHPGRLKGTLFPSLLLLVAVACPAPAGAAERGSPGSESAETAVVTDSGGNETATTPGSEQEKASAAQPVAVAADGASANVASEKAGTPPEGDAAAKKNGHWLGFPIPIINPVLGYGLVGGVLYTRTLGESAKESKPSQSRSRQRPAAAEPD